MTNHKPEFVCDECGKMGDDINDFSPMDGVDGIAHDCCCVRCFNEHVFEGPGYDDTGVLVWKDYKQIYLEGRQKKEATC